MPKQTYFNDSWLKEKEFCDWVTRAPTNLQVRCKLCKANFALGNMGIKALKSHAKGKSHNIKLEESRAMSNFFKPKSSSSTSNTLTSETVTTSLPDVSKTVDLTSTSLSSQSTISSKFHDGGKLNAEIRWTLKHILNGYSDNSCKETLQTFITMFPDSLIAAEMELGPNKMKYITNHGLAPHFKSILKADVTASEWVVASFDESLNKVTQDCEMDILVRFWDNNEDRVEVRYWDSMFFGHGTHKDIFNNFNNGLTGVDMSKLTQVSMDGPAVNWKFMKEVNLYREETKMSKLINIGSCNLHVVHGAFKTGAEFTDWNIKQILKGAFQVLKDTPARREDFISVTGTSNFPLNFCATR